LAFCRLQSFWRFSSGIEADVNSQLVLKRAPIGDNQEDYNVLEAGVIVGRIFLVPTEPEGRPWMWCSGHNREISRAAHRYEATREATMSAFAKSWRGQR
jgi:hypothetical protein